MRSYLTEEKIVKKCERFMYNFYLCVVFFLSFALVKLDKWKFATNLIQNV